MTQPRASSQAKSPWDEAALAAALFAVDPAGAGISLHAGVGPVRDAWLANMRELLPSTTPFLRMPSAIADDRLLGGLDLAATLRAGRPVAQSGLLAQADGGILVIAMAERVEASAAARVVAAMDHGQVCIEREGIGSTIETSFGVIALDEGAEPEEAPPAALLDRLAFHIDLEGIEYRHALGFPLMQQISPLRVHDVPMFAQAMRRSKRSSLFLRNWASHRSARRCSPCAWPALLRRCGKAM